MTGGYFPRKEGFVAKTKGDKKIVHVKPYTKKLNGKLVKVGEHYRSTED